MWQNIQDLIPKAAGKYNFAKALKAIEICQQYRKLAEKHLPDEALKNTFPKSYKNQILIIGVLSSAWAEKVQINKHRIHKSLKKKFGDNTVKKIKIELCERLPENLS
jgi:predicted nucleic acid-binding Zn ribbon protein